MSAADISSLLIFPFLLSCFSFYQSSMLRGASSPASHAPPLRSIMSGGALGSIHSGGRGAGGKPVQKSADDVNKDIRFLCLAMGSVFTLVTSWRRCKERDDAHIILSNIFRCLDFLFIYVAFHGCSCFVYLVTSERSGRTTVHFFFAIFI